MIPRTPLPPLALADLSERPASRKTRLIAGGFVLAMVGVGLIPSAFADQTARIVPAYVPGVGALSTSAELLTAYLLLSQFMVNGVRMFLALGAAYAFTGLLTIPYLLSFPGALDGSGGVFAKLDLVQTASTLWAILHLAFPLIVAVAVLRERWSSTRVLGDANLRRECIGALTLVAIACVTIGTLGFLLGSILPVQIEHGHLTRLFVAVIAPSVLVANATVALLVLRRAPLTTLQVWIAVTLAMASIDAVLNATTIGRFTPRWYVGKLLTLTTASVVLVALLA
ncbi:MAG: MASE4 domain-containing protein, partial [Vulcanimicrobiaceae bacterium]